MSARVGIRWQGRTTEREGTVPVEECEKRRDEDFG